MDDYIKMKNIKNYLISSVLLLLIYSLFSVFFLSPNIASAKEWCPVCKGEVGKELCLNDLCQTSCYPDGIKCDTDEGHCANGSCDSTCCDYQVLPTGQTCNNDKIVGGAITSPLCPDGKLLCSDGVCKDSCPNPPGCDAAPIPLYKQWDPRWGSLPYGPCGGANIASSGCGITALAMVISYWTGRSILPPETAKLAVNNGWRPCVDGTAWAAMTGMPPLFGLKSKAVSLAQAKEYLKNGVPVIQVHGAGYFTSMGHYIVVRGYCNGAYLINDPDGYYRTSATEEQITASLVASWVIWK